MTHEEQDIVALPPKLQRRMALLCLAGWRFERNQRKLETILRFGNEWMASKVACREYFGSTLLTLLTQMDCEYSEQSALTDAATP